MRELVRRLASFLRKGRWEKDCNDEFEAHLGMAIDENIGLGMTPEEARRQALIRFGGRESAKEDHRDARSLPFLEMLSQDLRYASRAMRRDIGFTIFAVLIVGLGIGACATVFSVLNAVLVRPLPFRQPDKLVWIQNTGTDEGMSAHTTQVNPFLDLKEHNHSYTDVAAYFAFYGAGDSVLQINGESERMNVVPVSQNFFPLLGVAPEIGRQFSADECKWNGPKAVLLSHGLWERRFASDRGFVGHVITLDNQRVVVAGILPAAFDFGSVFAPGTHVDMYVPFPLSAETNRWGNTLSIVGRLKPGVTAESAGAETSMIGWRYSSEHKNQNWFHPRVILLRQHVSGKFKPALMILAIAVFVVMLIVCANLSNLLLARSVTRQKEMAIRSALGAGRKRLIRQILTESILLSICGAMLGAALAWAGTRALAHLTTFNIPLLQDVHLDATALSFTLLLSLLTGLVFGLVPALQVPNVTVSNALKEQNRGSTDGKRHAWLRGSLVISEIAFACMLMVGTGLLIRSFLRVLNVNLGFQPARAASIRIDPTGGFDTPAKWNAYFDDVLRRVRNLPGVDAAGITDCLPLGRNRTWGAGAKGHVYTEADYPEAFVRIVSDNYVKAMGMKIIEGRDLIPSDDLNGPPVILVNRTLARNLWPNEDPIGKIMSADKERQVVGVVDDVRHLALEQGAGNEMYLPIRQSQDRQSIILVVRSKQDNAQLAGSVRAALLPLDPALPNERFVTLREIVDSAVSPRRFIVLLLSGFAGFALILASLGIYAVISYSVGQRTAEIGIRMALGASPGEVRTGILKQTLTLAGVGLLLGTLASILMTQALQGMLFGVTPSDPATFSAMLAILVGVALAAGYVPARRASRIDPMIALRAE
jgi:predicted permease